MMSPEQAMRAYWDRVQARDGAGVREILHNAVVVDWPASNERIIGPDNVLAVNREYPEGWSIRVLGILAAGERVASEVEVPMEGDGTYQVASFRTVREGRIARGTEYWISLGQDDVPDWSQRFTVAIPDA